MKVIFLDFDGCLNSEASFRMEMAKSKRLGVPIHVGNTLSEVACSNLQYVLNCVPDLKIVISSTWRLLHSLEELKGTLASYGVDSTRVIGITPNTPSKCRGHEIQLWLNRHPKVEDFIVMDDSYDMDGVDQNKIIYTTWSDGLLLTQAKRAVKQLGCTNPNEIR